MGKWIEAMRLRTLPVSISGVLGGVACGIVQGHFSLVPALLCLLFAVLAQIASNFGNEYYDYKKGVDHKGRQGFRRGVTEGDITPQAMKWATFVTLGATAVTGCLRLYCNGTGYSRFASPAGIWVGDSSHISVYTLTTWRKLVSSTGAALNPILGATTSNLLIFTILTLIISCL